jgi:hypothetical protein
LKLVGKVLKTAKFYTNFKTVEKIAKNKNYKIEKFAVFPFLLTKGYNPVWVNIFSNFANFEARCNLNSAKNENCLI